MDNNMQIREPVVYTGMTIEGREDAFTQTRAGLRTIQQCCKNHHPLCLWMVGALLLTIGISLLLVVGFALPGSLLLGLGALMVVAAAVSTCCCTGTQARKTGAPAAEDALARMRTMPEDTESHPAEGPSPADLQPEYGTRYEAEDGCTSDDEYDSEDESEGEYELEEESELEDESESDDEVDAWVVAALIVPSPEMVTMVMHMSLNSSPLWSRSARKHAQRCWQSSDKKGGAPAA